MAGSGATRDPVSELWDRAAGTILARVYQQRTGSWYATRIADPSAAHILYFLRVWDIDVTGPDRASTVSGRHVNYRTRWNRGFTRAVYYANKAGPGRPLEIQVGSPKAAGGGLPAGWAVRIRVRRGGSAAMRAVGRKRDIDRIWLDDGEAGGKFSLIGKRDWM